jgi:hypothetical protein
MNRPMSVSYLYESGSSPWAVVAITFLGPAGQPKRGALVTEIVLISLAVMAIAVVIGGLVGRLGDLDDLGTMRDMVDRS